MMLRQRGRFGHHSGGNDMQDSAAFHNSLRPICSMMYADALAARAPIVRVGPYPPEVTNEAPSTTNRFLTSCAWLYLLRTLFFGSAPIRAVPGDVAGRGGKQACARAAFVRVGAQEVGVARADVAIRDDVDAAGFAVLVYNLFIA